MSKPPVKERQTDELPPAGSMEVQEQVRTRRGRRSEESRRRRPKATYDLPLSMIEAIERVADKESIPRSDVVAWAVAIVLNGYDAGQVDWTPHKRPAKSLRWTHKLELPGRWGQGE